MSFYVVSVYCWSLVKSMSKLKKKSFQWIRLTLKTAAECRNFASLLKINFAKRQKKFIDCFFYANNCNCASECLFLWNWPTFVSQIRFITYMMESKRVDRTNNAAQTHKKLFGWMSVRIQLRGKNANWRQQQTGKQM